MSPLSAGIVAGAPGQPGKPTIGKGGNPDRPGVPLLTPGQIYLRSARPWSNGDRNLHFDARCTSSNGGQARNQPIDFSQSPLAHVTGLTPNKTYRCTAAASNKYGTGPRSTPSNALVV
jgi:hypothetical protein